MSTHNERVLVDRPRVTESVAKQSPRTRLRRGRPVRSRRQRHGQLDHLLLDDGAGHQGGLSCALGGGLSTRCAGIRRSGQNSGARDQGTTAWVLCRALRRAAALKLATWARNWTRRVDGVSNTVHPLGGCKPCDRDSAAQIRPTAESVFLVRREHDLRTTEGPIRHPGAPARLVPAPAAAATVPANVPSGAHGGCSDSSRALASRHKSCQQ